LRAACNIIGDLTLLRILRSHGIARSINRAIEAPSSPTGRVIKYYPASSCAPASELPALRLDARRSVARINGYSCERSPDRDVTTISIPDRRSGVKRCLPPVNARDGAYRARYRVSFILLLLPPCLILCPQSYFIKRKGYSWKHTVCLAARSGGTRRSRSVLDARLVDRSIDRSIFPRFLARR